MILIIVGALFVGAIQHLAGVPIGIPQDFVAFKGGVAQWFYALFEKPLFREYSKEVGLVTCSVFVWLLIVTDSQEEKSGKKS